MDYGDKKCENCGTGIIKDSEWGCPKCGWKQTVEKKGDYFVLYFCNQCGCHYSHGECPQHSGKKEE